MLLRTLDEKDKEINDLKQINSEAEIQITKLKTSLEESKKNHEYLLNNYKSAEKLSYFQNKVSQLSEEKAVILQTNAEAIKSLTNEINELNMQLNEYKKKELENLKVNNVKSPHEESNKRNQNTVASKADNKAELFFENKIDKSTADNKQAKQEKENENKPSSKKNVFDDESSEKLNNDKTNQIKIEKPKDIKATNTIDSVDNSPNTNPTSKSSYGRKDQGFFTRFIAPIFLTENELNNLNQD